MKAGRFFSNYVRSEDIKRSGPQVVTISSVEVEEIGPEGKKQKKLVAYFEEIPEQGAVLGSKAVGTFFTETFGDETDNWVGKKVEIYHDPSILYKGKAVGGIRFRKVEDEE